MDIYNQVNQFVTKEVKTRTKEIKLIVQLELSSFITEINTFVDTFMPKMENHVEKWKKFGTFLDNFKELKQVFNVDFVTSFQPFKEWKRLKVMSFRRWERNDFIYESWKIIFDKYKKEFDFSSVGTIENLNYYGQIRNGKPDGHGLVMKSPETPKYYGIWNQKRNEYFKKLYTFKNGIFKIINWNYIKSKKLNNISFAKEKHIAGGSFGEVYIAHLKTGIFSKEEIIYKRLKPKSYQTNGKDEPTKIKALKGMINNELCILLSLDHVNIVKCLGYVENVNKCPNELKLIVFEKCGDGLDDILKNQIDGYSTKYTTKKKLDVLLQIAKGMRYLHSVKYVHRDLKLGNIVMKGDTVKIIDFGVSKVVDSIVTSKSLTFSDYFTSPEAYFKFKNAKQNKNIEVTAEKPRDIYSFGMCMFCLLCEIYVNTQNGPNLESKTYYQTNKEEKLKNPDYMPIIPNKAKKKIQLDSKNDEYDETFAKMIELMEICLKYYPTDRPTFEEIVDYLEKL